MLQWLPMIVMLSLALLQPVKGAIVAMQWALHMHGFDSQPACRTGCAAACGTDR